MTSQGFQGCPLYFQGFQGFHVLYTPCKFVGEYEVNAIKVAKEGNLRGIDFEVPPKINICV